MVLYDVVHIIKGCMMSNVGTISRTCVFKNTWTYTESTSHHSPSSPSSLSSASSLLLLLLKRSACRLRLRCCCSTQILDTQAQKHATWVEKIPLMRPNRALWTLIKDNASYELTRACGKLCRIPCLKSTFAAPKCLYCGLQSTTNSCLQSTEHGDDLTKTEVDWQRQWPLASSCWLVGNAHLYWLQSLDTSMWLSLSFKKPK